MDNEHLQKFLDLYTQCSKLYANLFECKKYLISSYYKNDDNFIYSYDYIDFTLMFCNNTKEKNVLHNKFLSNDFLDKKKKYLIEELGNNAVILNDLQIKIKNNFIKQISEIEFRDLNNVYLFLNKK